MVGAADTGSGRRVASIAFRLGLVCLVVVGLLPSRAMAQGGAPLEVSKTVRARSADGFAPGAPVEYAIEVFNPRAVGVAEVVVEDTVDGVRLEAIEPLDGGVYDPVAGRVAWVSAGTGALRFIPPSGVVTVRLRARVGAGVAPGARVENVATVRVRGEAASSSDRAAFVVEGEGEAAYAVVKRVLPGPTTPGSAVGYVIEVQNVGDAVGNDVRLFDQLPAGLDYRGGSTTLDGAPLADIAGRAPFADGLALGRLDGVAGRLAPGARVTVGFEVVVRPGVGEGAGITNVARVVDGLGTAAQGSARFVVGGAPALAFVKTVQVVEDPGAERALVGQTLAWTLAVDNVGSGAAISTVVQDPIEGAHRYVAGSLAIEGVGLSDAPDRDIGQVVDGVVRVDVGDLVPGQGQSVTFRTVVEGGPQIRNQATAQAARQAVVRSDDGGEDTDAPTVIRVGEAPRRGFAIGKTARVESAGPGERVEWAVEVRNTGTIDLDGLRLEDALPDGLRYERVEGLPPGARVELDGSRVAVVDIGLPAGEAATLSVVTRIDPARSEGGQLCNVVTLSEQGGAIERAEDCVQVVVRRGRLSGVVFEDGDGDGAAGGAGDRVFGAMTVALSPGDDPDAAPLFEAETDAAGAFEVPALPPGDYRVRVFTVNGVQVHAADATVPATGVARLALAIDPSGRVYDSATGALVDGAEVFIYRDEDADRDPYDAESLARRVLVPPADLESATQQGQRTANGGLYRFAVRRPGRYLVEVVPPGASFTSPSVRVPPVPGYAFTDDPSGRVVPSDVPSVAPDADRSYFLAFDLGVDDFFQHNHIPIDPLSSLVELRKTSRRTQASVGEVVTFELDLVNRSPDDLVYDPATESGGVMVQDVLPRGLKYVGRTTTLVRVRGGVETPIAADDPTGQRILRFGRFVEEGGRLVQRPLDLRAGEALRLRYHTIVSADAEPRRVIHNRAVLLADGNIPISPVAEAAVRIVADEDLDQGLLLGRVWCDADGDGRQSAGERGLAGARLYLDNGYRVTTDSAGQYHFKDIDPGTHAVKIDTATLLPGAALTTDETRVIHFTRGLPAKVDFGVTCPAETVSGATLELADEGVLAALASLRDRYVVLTGDVDALRVVHGEQVYQAPGVAVQLLVDGQPATRPDLPAGALGTSAALAFRVALDAEAPRARWGLYVGPNDGDARLVAGGEGPPPAQFDWDGRDPDGAPMLEAGRAYRFWVEVAGRDGGLVGSAAQSFGVGLAQPPPPGRIARLPGDDFTDDDRPRPALRKALAPLVPQITAAIEPGGPPVVVEVHHDNSRGPISARSLTRRRAEAVVALLEELGVPAGALTPDGLGGSRPLRPNITDRNQRLNRRIDIVRRLPPAAAEVPAPAFEPQVRVDARAVTPDADGRFALTAEVPPDGTVEVLVHAADGRRAMFPIPARVGAPRPVAAPRQVLVEGTLPDGLTVGGRATRAPLAPPRVAGPIDPAATTLRFTFEAPPDADGWRFTVRGPDGAPLHTAGGAGPPPATLDHPSALPAGATYQLTVRRGAAIAQSAPGVLGGALPSPGDGSLRVDGRRAERDTTGRIRAMRTVAGDEPLLLEAVAPDGARQVWFAQPPTADGAEAPPLATADAAEPPPPGGGSAIAPPARGATPTADAPPLPPLTAPVVRQTLPTDARAALSDFGRDALVAVLAPVVSAEGVSVPAREVTVELPPADAALPGTSVPVRGATVPGNRVFLNGAEVPVDERGQFAAAVDLPPGPGEIEIRTVDPQGNRGVIRRPVRAAESGWFLLALGEGLTGQLESALDGVEPHTRVEYGDRLYLHGRAAAWFRGYAKGSDILGGAFEQYRAEVHLDTARRDVFEESFRQLVDPETFYPVYGDAADLDKPVNTRGPLYVLLEADDNTARIGNFVTDLGGIELFRYDRALYGAAVDIDDTTGDFRHEVTAFAADTDLAQRHAYVELRGTGGSLYYLPHRELVEGSERIFLVERDRVSGTERSRTPLARGADYTLRYDDGRLLLESPLPSVTLDAFGARPQPDRGEVLDGHPLYLAVEYDHRDPFEQGDTTVGVRARETWNDTVSVGAGYVQEGRGEGAIDYKLWGADLEVRGGRRTRLQAEVARSQSVDAESLRSDDGGLTFGAFHDRGGEETRGTSYLLRGGLELDDLVGDGTRDWWYTEGYYQVIESGFHAGGSIAQQGLTKYGGASRYQLGGGHSLHLRHDGEVADDPLTQSDALLRAWRRDVTRAGYGYRHGALSLDLEYVHTDFDPGTTDTPVTGVETGGEPLLTDAVAGTLAYRLTDRWTALAEQEIILRTDERLHDDPLDLLTTTVGARYRIDDTLHLEALETLRWSGANATQIGVRTDIDDRHSLYLQERLAHEDGRTHNTTVIGGEERFGKGGRAYGEYQLETGSLGERNRAVMGVGKRFRITDGLTLDAAYERSQVTSGATAGEFSRDAISLGAEWLQSERLKLSGRYELRDEDNDEALGRRDRRQFLALNAVSFKLGPDFTALGRLNYSLTYDLELHASEAELLEASVGLAWRPVAHDWVAGLFKYTKRYDQRPYDLLTEKAERIESDAVSIIPIVELPWRFQLVEKLVVKRSAIQVANLPTVVSTTILWINRLNYHLTETWDAGVEYRVLTDSLSSTSETGALVEVAYIIQKRIRLGAGYNFTSFSDDEYADLDESFGGPFFRVTAHY